jgi:hypothetical protein
MATMRGMSYNAWERRFTAAAEKDDFGLIEAYCDFIGSGVSVWGAGDPVMQGTKQMIWSLASVDFYWPDAVIDHAQKLLRMQTYDPAKAKGAKYVIGVESDAFGWAASVPTARQSQTDDHRESG